MRPCAPRAWRRAHIGSKTTSGQNRFDNVKKPPTRSGEPINVIVISPIIAAVRLSRSEPGAWLALAHFNLGGSSEPCFGT